MNFHFLASPSSQFPSFAFGSLQGFWPSGKPNAAQRDALMTVDIHRKRERERGKRRDSIYTYTCIYIYKYMQMIIDICLNIHRYTSRKREKKCIQKNKEKRSVDFFEK